LKETIGKNGTFARSIILPIFKIFKKRAVQKTGKYVDAEIIVLSSDADEPNMVKIG
jgi:hypothetical protein